LRLEVPVFGLLFTLTSESWLQYSKQLAVKATSPTLESPINSVLPTLTPLFVFFPYKPTSLCKVPATIMYPGDKATVAAAATREKRRDRLEELDLEEKLKKNLIRKTPAQP
jgi:hypothetical protein